MTTPLAQLDRRADALLLALVEAADGDLRTAFVLLCSRVTLEDLTGETFEAAIARAVGAWFGERSCPFPRLVAGANGAEGQNG